MSLKRSFLSLLLYSIVSAAPTESLDRRDSQQIKWAPCPKDGPNAALYAAAKVPIECGSLVVPLDWTAPDSNATHKMSLLRVPAATQPAKGTIQMNFGGPGMTAISSLAGGPQSYQKLSGGVYDLIAYDPRGTSLELPFVCMTNNYTIGAATGNMPDMSLSERDARRGWAAGKAFAGLCKYQGNGNETAEYIGTAFMARDIARIAEVVDKDGLIRFWGFSYGTTLGATIASMFPERVDRMVIDGIQNAKQYYYEWTDSELWTLNDKVVDYFFTSCVAAGPEHCALAAATNRTGPEMSRDLYNFIENINAEPIGLSKTGTIFSGDSLKPIIFQNTYGAEGWAEFAQVLALILYGNEEQRIETLTALHGGIPTTVGDLGATEPMWGIHCGDRVPRTDDYEEIAPSLRKQYGMSYYIGGQNGLTQAVCAQWPWKAKEVYQGNFTAKTRHPILVMSNSLDGQTPLASARNMSAGFEGAVVLENDGVGHATASYSNSCTATHMMAYWVNGTMPKEGTVCEAEYGPYETRSWPETFARMANGTAKAKGIISAKKWLEEQY